MNLKVVSTSGSIFIDSLYFQNHPTALLPIVLSRPKRSDAFPECVAKGSRLTLGGLGVELCSRPVASMFATVGNRPQ